MKRLVAVSIMLGFLSPYIPPFVPTTWANIAAEEWEPLPWPGIDVEEVQVPDPLDAKKIDGIIGQRILNNELDLQARFMTVPGVEAQNIAVVDKVLEAIARQESAAGTEYMPEAHPKKQALGDRDCVLGSTNASASDIMKNAKLAPKGGMGVAVVCDVVVALGPIIAQKIRTVDADDSTVHSDEAVTIYQDTSIGKSYAASSLWDEKAGQYVWDALVSVLKRDAGSEGLSWVTAAPDDAVIEKALNTTLVQTGGKLLVTFEAGITSSDLQSFGIEKTDRAITISLNGASLAQVLSDRGKKLVDISSNATAYEPPKFVSAGHDHIDCTLLPCVALTYDDGPTHYTPQILDDLAAKHASVTFFVLGSMAAANPDIIARAHAEGHLVQNHTWSHADLSAISDEAVSNELNETNALILEITGEEPTMFRPPYGTITDKVFDIAGMPAILWDIDTNDWQGPSNKVLIRRAVDFAYPGSIILQHDVQKNTSKTITDVVDGLKDRGFSLVNINQLFNGDVPHSGPVYAAY